MISRFFIDRPIFASVLSIIIMLLGGAAIMVLPVEQYPEIVPPEVVVRATYPGASAADISEAVAAPLEQQINGVDNMLYMRSVSNDAGSMQITISFDVGSDPDQATIDVNNRVQAAMSKLPQVVRNQGVNVEKRSSNILQVITLKSPGDRLDTIFISNYGLVNVIDELKRVPGVGDARLFGAQDYSMRIWLRPDRLRQYDLSPNDVARAIAEQNSQFAAGSFGAAPGTEDQAFTYTVTTIGRFDSTAQFEEIILRADEDGGSLRLKDVARIELGAQDYSFSATHNNEPAVPIGIFLQPGANALATATAVRERMAELAQRFPPGLEYGIPFDTTEFVEVSIEEVIKTFFEALVLVVAVTLLFLQNWRAALIPIVAIPVSLIGTFAGLYALGFSINLLSLFAMVLAIGIVVDDAIIVIENVERLMSEGGKSPREAAIQAMREVTGPIIAVTLALCAVFTPMAFLEGLTGQLYRQFAVTISISVVISAVVALTLSPALCAILLKHDDKSPSLPFRWFNRGFAAVSTGYNRLVGFFLRHGAFAVLIFIAIIGVAASLFQKLPTSLMPAEDQGYVFVTYSLPPAAAVSRTAETRDALGERLLAQDWVDDATSFAGYDLVAGGLRTNSGIAFVQLSDWSERPGADLSSQALAGRIMGLGAELTDAMVIAFNPPPIRGMSFTGGFEAYVQSRSGDNVKTLGEKVSRLVDAANAHPVLANVQTTLNANVPRYEATVDRAKARALDVPIDDLFATMQATFGSLYVNDFTLLGRNFQVNLQAEAEFRDRPDDLADTYVRSTTGEYVPLTSLVQLERVLGADLTERFNVFPAAKILGEPAPGYSSGQAIAAMEVVAREVLGTATTLEWIGEAYQQKTTGDVTLFAFIAALIMVFLILAAQYERWSMPLVVLTVVPFATLGAIIAVMLSGMPGDLYFQVGLVVLIGVAAKNSILIVEFAMLERKAGRSPSTAAANAARLRFRPIVMTATAFILGVTPLVLSSGAGAAARQSIGTGIIGGMIAATLLAPVFVPAFFSLSERATARLSRALRRSAPAGEG